MKISTINFLVALKNASIANKNFVSMQTNSQIIQFLQCLYLQSFILSYNYCLKKKKVYAYFNMAQVLNFFNNLKIMSTSSYNGYIKYLDLCKIIAHYKVLVISTNKGLLTGDACKKYKIGGKLLFLS